MTPKIPFDLLVTFEEKLAWFYMQGLHERPFLARELDWIHDVTYDIAMYDRAATLLAIANLELGIRWLHDRAYESYTTRPGYQVR